MGRLRDLLFGKSEPAPAPAPAPVVEEAPVEEIEVGEGMSTEAAESLGSEGE